MAAPVHSCPPEELAHPVGLLEAAMLGALSHVALLRPEAGPYQYSYLLVGRLSRDQRRRPDGPGAPDQQPPTAKLTRPPRSSTSQSGWSSVAGSTASPTPTSRPSWVSPRPRFTITSPAKRSLARASSLAMPLVLLSRCRDRGPRCARCGQARGILRHLPHRAGGAPHVLVRNVGGGIRDSAGFDAPALSSRFLTTTKGGSRLSSKAVERCTASDFPTRPIKRPVASSPRWREPCWSHAPTALPRCWTRSQTGSSLSSPYKPDRFADRGLAPCRPVRDP